MPNFTTLSIAEIILRGMILHWPHWNCLHFILVVGLEWPKDPKSYAGGSLLLVGSCLPDRSKVMAQAKRSTLVLQVGGWSAGWRPTPIKALITKTQRMSLRGVKRRRTWRCLRIGTWNVLSLYTPGASNILTLRWLMSYIYGAPILDVSRSHTTTQHSR